MWDTICIKYGLNGQMGPFLSQFALRVLFNLTSAVTSSTLGGAVLVGAQRGGTENKRWRPPGGHLSCMEA